MLALLSLSPKTIPSRRISAGGSLDHDNVSTGEYICMNDVRSTSQEYSLKIQTLFNSDKSQRARRTR